MDPKKMKVPELRAELEKRGLSLEGKKPDLVSRLQSRLDEEEFGLVPAVGAAGPSPSSSTSTTGAAAPAPPSAPPPPPPEPTKPTVEQPQKVDPPASAPAADPPATSQSEATKKGAAAAGAGAVGTASAVLKKAETLTFQEKKQLRKERFGLPDDETEGSAGISGGTGAAAVSAEELEKRKKRAQKFGTTVKGEEALTESRAKKSKKGDSEDALLPKEEIERQLERIRKLGGSEERADELKAMLRRYRFENKS